MSNKPTLPYGFAKAHGVLIEYRDEQGLHILCKSPENYQAIAEIRRQYQCPITLQTVTDSAFNQKLSQAYQAGTQAASQVMEGIEDELALDDIIEQLPKTQDLLETQDDAPIIRLLNALFTQAIKQQASDIHIETYEHTVVVRMRVDGVLQEVLTTPRTLAPLIISRIKVMSKLDIAEKRIPQDGRMSLTIAGHGIDIRVSTLPASHAERLVMRILDQNTARLDIHALGMQSAMAEKIHQLIQASHGIILVTGPTGSGKSTTLYAMLSALNDKSRNILTIEDPIEYDIQGIGQTQVNPKVEMTFAKGLRAILRQDPDIVMVGEIRDAKTAEIAVQASLTGHLVLSTLHTNSAIGALTRLSDMGVENFLLASSIIGLCAQRLVRKLCGTCKIPEITDQQTMQLLGIDTPATIYQSKGCPACFDTGYKGRTGIYEIILLNEHLKQQIHDGINEERLLSSIRHRSKSLEQDAIERVLDGTTSIKEVNRCLAPISA